MIRHFFFTFLLAGVATAGASAQTSTLKEAFKDDFYVGAAMNQAQISEKDARGLKLITQHFNSISPENALKWEKVHPKPNQFNFGPADKYVEFGVKHHMFIVGHTLVWHNQTPKWVFEDAKGKSLTREALLKRMHDHITTVVRRYKGRINGWDVVNEALDEDGNLRDSPWKRIIGDDYVEKAFQYAHETDPKAELYYNDYNLEHESKRKGAIKLIEKLKSEGIPVHAVGLQGHDTLDWPSAKDQDETIAAFEKAGVKVAITELDITVLPAATKQPTAEITTKAKADPKLNPYTAGLPEDVQKKLAAHYAELFEVFVKHRDTVERVTFWGVTDADSWKNNWPVPGRTDYPLLFDRNGAPKLAFEAVIGTAGTPSTSK